MPDPQLQDVVRIFHAECGGQVIGPLEGPWTCNECGAEMRRMVSDEQGIECSEENPGGCQGLLILGAERRSALMRYRLLIAEGECPPVGSRIVSVRKLADGLVEVELEPP